MRNALLTSSARRQPQRAEFSLYTPGTKKSMHFLHKKRSAFSPDFVGSDERKFLTFGVTGVIISIESERGERRKASEKSSKNLLTNRFQSAIMVIEDKRNERQTATASSQKSSKNLLTSSLKSAIIEVQRGNNTSVSNFSEFEKKFKKPLDKPPKV